MPNVAPNLQQDLVLATWTRRVVLEDSASAAKLTPLLPNSLRESAGTGVGFSRAVDILRNPGKEQPITTAAQYQRLQQLRYAAALLGQRRINDAKGRPDALEVPEALALTVRATRYTCADWGKDS